MSIAQVSVATPRRSSNVLLVVASSLIGMTGYGFYSGLPIILGAFADSRGIPTASLGWIASSENFGLLLGGLAAAWLGRTSGRRLTTVAGLLLVAVAHLASTSPAAGFDGLMLARLAGGLGGGCIYAIAVSSLASTARPDRSAATFTAILTLVAVSEIGVMPIVIGRFGIDGAFWLLLSMVLLCLPFVLAIPPKAPQAVTGSAATIPPLDRRAWLLLAGIACFHVAPIVFWTYGERMGVGGGISETTIGAIFTIWGIVAAIACFGTEPIAKKMGQAGSLRWVTMVLAVGLLTWLVGSITPLTYLLRASLVGIPWVLGGVFQINVANQIDPTGRLSGLVGPAQNLGLMVGPALASMLLAAGQAFAIVLSVATIFLVLSMILCAVSETPGRHPRISTLPHRP